jgi:hypothetical protein
MPTTDPFDDKGRHLTPLTSETLRDVARNGAAPYDYRKLAAEILRTRRSPYYHHSDLREFKIELEAELDGVQFELPAPDPAPAPNPMKAGFTTQTMFGGETTDMEALRKPEMDKALGITPDPGFTGFDSVQLVDRPKTRRKKPDAA